MSGLMKKLRRNDCYIAMSEYLNELGYPYEPSIGKGHPYLLVHVQAGPPIRVFFPLSGSDRRNADNSVTQLKKLIRKRLGSQSIHGA